MKPRGKWGKLTKGMFVRIYRLFAGVYPLSGEMGPSGGPGRSRYSSPPIIPIIPAVSVSFTPAVSVQGSEQQKQQKQQHDGLLPLQEEEEEGGRRGVPHPPEAVWRRQCRLVGLRLPASTFPVDQ